MTREVCLPWMPWKACWLRFRHHQWGEEWQGLGRIRKCCQVCGASRVVSITGMEGIFGYMPSWETEAKDLRAENRILTAQIEDLWRRLEAK